MKVDSTTNNSNHAQQSFGILYKPSKKKIIKKVGLHAAEEFDRAEIGLKNLAHDRDIKISVINNKEFIMKKFKITISDVIKNPIRRMLGMFPKDSIYITMGETINNIPLSELLLLKTAKLKSKFRPTKAN